MKKINTGILLLSLIILTGCEKAEEANDSVMGKTEEAVGQAGDEGKTEDADDDSEQEAEDKDD